MSETRPPITAGPIERAFKFLKSTSVSCDGVGEGEGKGVVATGDAVAVGRRPGVSSCADKIETDQIEASKVQKIPSRIVISRRH